MAVDELLTAINARSGGAPPSDTRSPAYALADGAYSMLDILMVTIALALFATTLAYAHACDRL
jgi:hypothetical protein